MNAMLHKIRSSILLLLLAGTVFSASGQRGPSSFYFESPQPPEAESRSYFPPSFVGEYLSTKDSLTRLLVQGSKLQTISLRIFTIPRTRIDSNENIFIRNGLIHGIRKEDSLEVVEEQAKVFVFWNDRSTLFDLDKDEHVLRERNDTLFLNYRETKGRWTLMLFHKNAAGNPIFKNFNHDPAWTAIQQIRELDSLQGNSFPVYLATPEKKEFDRLLKTDAFTPGVEYFEPQP